MTAITAACAITAIKEQQSAAALLLSCSCMLHTVTFMASFISSSAIVRALPNLTQLALLWGIGIQYGTSQDLFLCFSLLLAYPFIGFQLWRPGKLITLLALDIVSMLALSPFLGLVPEAGAAGIETATAMQFPLTTGHFTIVFWLALQYLGRIDPPRRARKPSYSPELERIARPSHHGNDEAEAAYEACLTTLTQLEGHQSYGPAYAALTRRLSEAMRLHSRLNKRYTPNNVTSESFDIGQAIEEVAMVMAPALHARDIQFVLDLAIPDELLVQGRQDAVSGLLVQLLAPALRVGRPGEIEIHLSEFSRQGHVELRLEVQDRTQPTLHSQTDFDAALHRLKPWVDALHGQVHRSMTALHTTETVVTFRAPELSREPSEPLPARRALILCPDPETTRILSRHLTNWGMQVRSPGYQRPVDAATDIILVHSGLHPNADEAAREFRLRPEQILIMGPLDPGTRTDITIPIRRSDLYDALRQALTAVEAPRSSHASATRRALVADDSPVDRKLLVHHLSTLGFECDVAANGDEALARFQPEVHQVVFTDLCMPGTDGRALAEGIRSRSAHARVVAVSALPASESVLGRDEDNPFDLILQKPIRLQNILKTVERLGELLPEGDDSAGNDSGPACT